MRCALILSTEQSGLVVKSRLFRGLGDPSRLGILETLRGGPLTVGEIVKKTGLAQSNVSNHLSCLRDCGLVTAEQKSRYVWYRLSDDRVGELLRLAESLLADVARGVYECTRYDAPVHMQEAGAAIEVQPNPGAQNDAN